MLNTAQDVQMQVEIIFLLVKYARKFLRGAASDDFDCGIGDQVQVELRA